MEKRKPQSTFDPITIAKTVWGAELEGKHPLYIKLLTWIIEVSCKYCRDGFTVTWFRIIEEISRLEGRYVPRAKIAAILRWLRAQGMIRIYPVADFNAGRDFEIIIDPVVFAGEKKN